MARLKRGGPRRQREQRPRAILRAVAFGLWAIALLEGGVIGLSFLLLSHPESDWLTLAGAGAAAVVVMTFATAGWLVVRQRPTHAVGWLMVVGGLLAGVVFGGTLIGASLFRDGNPAAAWVILPAPVLFGPAIFVIGPAVALLFPDGHLPSRRWRLPMWALVATIGLGTLAAIIRPGPLQDGLPDNPLGMVGWPGQAALVVGGLLGIALSASGFLAVASLIVRYRGAGADERHQLKWFISAVAVWAAVFPFLGGSNVLELVGFAGLALVPVSVVIAISRYRLYEIDTLINRTLVYVPLVAIVAGVFAACEALLQRAFVALTGDTSDAAVVISALILAAVFTPIRNTLQAAVDRRFKPADVEAVAVDSWRDPAFEIAVERIVRRVLSETDTDR